MQLHFLVPGLIWADPVFKAALADRRLPALDMLLARGRWVWHAPATQESALAGLFGQVPDATPYAALRKLGETSAAPPGPDHWLCADPVTLRFTQHGMLLGDGRTLGLSRDEADALVAELNQQFPDLGEFFAPAADRWLLRLRQPAGVRFHPPSKAVGRRVEVFFPEGEQRRTWVRNFNEVQVVLHNHPVNRRREDSGFTLVNSVWFWGGGSLADLQPLPADLPSQIWTDDALALGFARHAGAATHSLPAHFPEQEMAKAGRTLVILPHLSQAAHYGELLAWTEALMELEQKWFAPALNALKDGRISTLRLTGPGDLASLELNLNRSDCWKFWRRGSGLAQLDVPDLTR